MKSLDDFVANDTKKDGKHNMCRPCQKEYNAAYYQRTKQLHNPARAATRDKLIVENQGKLIEYLRGHPCVDCGEADIVVLQFDHQRDKVANVSRMVRSSNWTQVELEMNKCEVVCANCHARRTAKQFGWLKALTPP